MRSCRTKCKMIKLALDAVKIYVITPNLQYRQGCVLNIHKACSLNESKGSRERMFLIKQILSSDWLNSVRSRDAVPIKHTCDH